MCCAPCSIYPVQELRTGGMNVTGFFFNHNIHPYQEYLRRLETVRRYAEMVELEVIYRDEYRLEEFLAGVAREPGKRCLYCYSSRLERVAEAAVESGFESFSTTLLYSRYQKHDLIREMGERIAGKYCIRFHYDDFRRGWHEGIALCRKMELYRQKYCGCIYSEKDRYLPQEKGVGGS